MTWIEHPKFRPVRDMVLDAIHSKERQFRNVRPVVFLCGGFRSENRINVDRFLRKNVPDALLFHADDVWPFVAKDPASEALAMEKELATLSDIVIVIVESPGTFTELGAFSMYEPLRKKLLPILDHRYKAAESFINTGPIRAIDRESQFAPTIWADFNIILTCGDELLQRLRKLPEAKDAYVKELVASQKHFFLFLCDLIFIFGPVSVHDLEVYCKHLYGDEAVESIPRLAALATAMHLVRHVVVDGVYYYYRTLAGNEHPSFQSMEYLSLPAQRAKVVSVLLTIPRARDVLEKAAAQ